MVAKFTRSFG